jgi:hypothetical protein
LKALTRAGLDRELRLALSHLYASIRLMHEGQTFVSWSSALQLRQRHYDEDDHLYILARRDDDEGFAEQPGWEDHLAFLASRVDPVRLPPVLRKRPDLEHAPPKAPGINQVRVIVANSKEAAKGRATDVRALHRPGTLFYFRHGHLDRFELLRDLKYGLVVSTQHRYAMISVAPVLEPYTVGVRNVVDLVSKYKYSRKEGDMRAIVTADRAYVSRAIREFEELLVSRDAHCLPSGQDATG